ncbi:MAG: toll/interleukin-1 receptor domain-containing protein [Blastocatellia bacterium]
MANLEHLEILKQGVEVWNDWKKANFEIRPDLSDADLSGADLFHADLSDTDLSNAKLDYAELVDPSFSKANLVKTSLRNATIVNADFINANLSEANLGGAFVLMVAFSGANLINADLGSANITDAGFNYADLSRANLDSAVFKTVSFNNTIFSETTIWRASFDDCDLIDAIDLDSVIHRGPSTIGIDTLYNSKGNITEVFLRGCGLKDWEIEAAKLYRADLSPGQATEIVYKVHELRTNPAIQFSSCFISYSSKNHAFAENLYKHLQDIGVRCWFAPEDLKIGDKFRQRIDEAIRFHDKLLLILSEDSIASAWVEDEVEAALERERLENRLILFPVRIDDAVEQSTTAWTASLRRMRHIGDFSKWKDHYSYSKALDRLLRDLKAESKS